MLTAALSLALGQTQIVTLRVGNTPPPLAPGAWVKGKPVKLEKGQVIVVEFWATWCPPCRESIPHLTKLQKQYGSKVKIVGISVWEDNDPVAKGQTYLSRVKAFVQKQGAKMDYTVAMDDAKGTMADRWMQRAGQNGIPTAFIIGKDLKIAWIGSPFEIDQPLAKIVARK